MRKLVTLCLLITAGITTSVAQVINVSGTVVNNNGDGVAGVELLVNAVFSDSTFFFVTAATDVNGYYEVDIPVPPTSAIVIVTVSLIDCNGTLLDMIFTWVPGITTDFVADFVYCGGTGGGDSCAVAIIPEFDPTIAQTILFALPLNNTAGVTFAWNTGETTQSIVPDTFGTYCVDMTTADGCVASDCFEFVGDSTNCFVMISAGNTGSTPGDVLVATAYGVPPFAYAWSTGETTASIPIPGPGEYCVSVTDATGCSASDCIMIDSTTCSVHIIATPNGGLEAIGFGAEPITYEWSTGEAGPVIFPTQPGTYCVSMVDANGCAATACYTYAFSDCEVFIAYEGPGTLAAIAFGHPPFTYLWNTGETTAAIQPVEEGEYCVTISDANGCTAFTCDYYTPFDFCETVLIYTGDPTTGTVGNTLFAFSLGIPPFTYLWSTGDSTESIQLDSLVPGICVTVTDATGCVDTACTDELLNNCWSWISIEYTGAGATLTAVSDVFATTPAQSYLWSTGETTHAINVTVEGTYCVTVTNANGCASESCVVVDFGIFGDTCLALVLAYPDPTTANSYTVEALAFGHPPFTYDWSTGDSTAVIQVQSLSNDLCVTVTDATGCVAEACYIDINFPFCDVWIDAHPTDSSGVWALTAFGNALNPNWSYQWSTGDTTPSILVSATGDYCVTVTSLVAGDSCVAEACVFVDVEFGDPSDAGGPIEGFIHGNGFSHFSGTAGLYTLTANDPANSVWSLVDTTRIVEGNFYSFSHVDAGIYAVKVTLDAGTDASVQFFPTWYLSAVEWDQADPIFVPNALTVLHDITLVQQSGATGVGVISGTLIDPENLLPTPELRSGGIAGIQILLLDADGEPLRYTLTNESGAYTFASLPWGTYRLKFEHAGVVSPEMWVTIGPDHPAANGIVMSTSELTSSTRNLLDAAAVTLFPQPASDYLTVELDADVQAGLTMQVMTLNGQVVQQYAEDLFEGTGNATLDVSGLSSGMYLLRLLSEQGQITRKWIKQ
ncbi:MAG: T9SS type A sorting domain-containing protein [Saprospiraceae bacterium]|nr:T9SS type A sorting domain-containing protein [Saprospiraceae bacterium]